MSWECAPNLTNSHISNLMSQLSRSSILCIPLVLGQYRLGSSYSSFGIYPLSFLSRHSNSLARLCGDFTVGTSLSAKGKGRGTPKWRYLLACREGVSYSMEEVLALSGEGANSASTGIKICRANGTSMTPSYVLQSQGVPNRTLIRAHDICLGPAFQCPWISVNNYQNFRPA